MPPFRRLSTADLPACLVLAADRSWDADSLRWHLMLQIADVWGLDAPDGGLAACGFLTRYHPAYATIGLLVVRRDHGRRGLATRLMAHLHDGGTEDITCLFATPMGRPLYRKLGYLAVDQIHKYIGPLEVASPPDGHLAEATPGDLDTLVSLDAAATGLDRRHLLTALFGRADRRLLLSHNGQYSGYGLAVPGSPRTPTVIGPLVAPDALAARMLIAGLAKDRTHAVRIDVFARHGDLPSWLQAGGMTHVSTDPMMLRGAASLPGDRRRLIAIASQALG